MNIDARGGGFASLTLTFSSASLLPECCAAVAAAVVLGARCLALLVIARCLSNTAALVHWGGVCGGGKGAP